MGYMISGPASDVAIRVEGLSKLYHIGRKQEKYRTMRDTLAEAVSTPARRLRSLLRGTGNVPVRKYEDMWALRDITFQVKPGEVVGVIGRNGAGKSTLLKILSRITEPTSGQAVIRGRVGSLLEVGTGFHPELTGRENILLNGAILGMKQTDIRRKFDEIIDFAEVERFVDTPVKHYSSGMYLRLAFAVAAHLVPDILLVDEVLAVGDMAFQKKCLGKMGEVSKEGRTVLFVSHNMTAISSLTTRCLALAGGSLYDDGPTSLVIRRYLVDPALSEGRYIPLGSLPDDDTFELDWCLVGQEGSSTDFRSDESIPVVFRYKVKQPVQALRVGFDLISQEGVQVFRAYQDDQIRDPETIIPGTYTSTCQIPAELLNDGQYSINIRASIWGVRPIYIIDQALRFNVVNLVGNNSQYGHQRPGVINPLLTWVTKPS